MKEVWKPILLVLGLCALVRCYGQADIAVSSFTVSPMTIYAGLAPDQVTVRVLNNGPDYLPILPGFGSLVMEYRLSPSPDPLAAGAIVLTNILATVNLGIPVGQEIEFDYDSLNRSDLAIPPWFKGTNGYYFLYATPYMDTDPNPTDNLAMFGPITVMPMVSTQYMVFSQEIPFSMGIELTSTNSVGFNYAYGNSWVFSSLSSSFSVRFPCATRGQVRMHVRHLTSYRSSCPGGGFSPVSIFCNSVQIANNYDPAANHGGVHSFVDDYWTVRVQEGNNTLRWEAGNLCTRYWIQMVELLPALPVFDKISANSTSIVLNITGSSANGGMLQDSTNCLSWTDVMPVPAFDGSYSLVLTNSPRQRMQLFRLRLN